MGRKWATGGSATLVATVSIALSAPVAPALATELTRAEWVDRVEPICKTNVLTNKRIFKGAKQEVKEGELRKASRHFTRAATAFAKTIRQIEGVPQPPADEAKIATWLGYLRAETDFVKRIGAALAAEKRHKAESTSVKLNRNSTRANNAALGFEFDYCRIDPSRFG